MYRTLALFFIVLLNISFAFGDQCISEFSAGEYGVVTAKYVSIRESPSINSRRIDYAHIGLRVQILEISNECVEVNKQRGRWLRIIGKNHDSFVQKDKLFKGWMFNKYVMPFTNFKPIEQWERFEEFYSCGGDWCLKLHLQNDGSFKAKGTDSYNNTEETIGYGKAYRAGKMIWFKFTHKDIKNWTADGYILVQNDHGYFCLGKDIDYNTGECHEYGEYGIIPEPQKKTDNYKDKKIGNELITI